MIINVKKLKNCPQDQLSKKFKNDAGYDLRSSIDFLIKPLNDLKVTHEDVTFSNGKVYQRNRYEKQLIPTGIKIHTDQLSYFWIVPRSGFSSKFMMGIRNSPGLIDYDYRGELFISVFSYKDTIPIAQGDRIAQLVPVPTVNIKLVFVEEVPASLRGEGGFGSTGIE